VLRSGGIVALPTDTVYGIAADLAVPGAIDKLFAAKRRPPDRGIVLLLAAADQAASVGVLGSAGQALAEACWPGGVTLVVPEVPGARLPAVLSGGAGTIGIRVPDHPSPRAISAALGPLPTTSANRSGEPDACTAPEVLAALGDDVDLVLDGGRSPGGRPSTVVDLTTERPRIARHGAVPESRVRAVLAALGLVLESTDQGAQEA
jgi:L-threonylcarbamoyladenylate synthase